MDNNLEFNFNTETAPEPNNRTPQIICIGIIIVLSAAILVFGAKLFLKSSPEDTVITAFKNAAEDTWGDEKTSFFDMIASQPSETDFSLTYKSSDYAGDYNSVLEGSGLTASLLYDPETQEVGGSLDASAAGMPVSIGEFYCGGSEAYGRIPILEKTWVKIGLENIFSKYNASALADYMGESDYTEDFSIDLFDIPSLPDNSRLLYSYINSDRAVFASLKSNMTVTEAADSYILESGKKADGYSVILQGRDITEVISDFNEYIKEESDYTELINKLMPLLNIAGNNLTAEEIQAQINESCDRYFEAIAEAVEDREYECTVYVCNKKLVRAELNLEKESFSVNITASLPSGEEEADITEFELTATDGGSGDVAKITAEMADYGNEVNIALYASAEPYEITFSSDYLRDTAEYTASFDLKNSYYANQSFNITSEGTYEKTDNSFSFSADDISITDVNGNNLLSFGLELNTAALSQTIGKPDGDIVDLFTDNEEELNALIKEIQDGYSSLYSMLMLMGIG
ncbi:MAG: hypothetical protein LUC97_00070 [Clostridiales bacterium]|nr:hypothetical protein [Clostridiales bacterium]